MGPIPWDVIVNYGFTKGFDNDNLDILCVLIMELDKVYLENLNESKVRQQKQFEQQNASAGRRTVRK
jgi:hypothetical protein